MVKKIQNHGYEHDHDLLWIKDAPIYGIILKNEEIENFVDMYIGCDVLLLSIALQNAQHRRIKKCKKKITCYLQIPLSITPHEYNKNITSIQIKKKKNAF